MSVVVYDNRDGDWDGERNSEYIYIYICVLCGVTRVLLSPVECFVDCCMYRMHIIIPLSTIFVYMTAQLKRTSKQYRKRHSVEQTRQISTQQQQYVTHCVAPYNINEWKRKEKKVVKPTKQQIDESRLEFSEWILKIATQTTATLNHLFHSISLIGVYIYFLWLLHL